MENREVLDIHRLSVRYPKGENVLHDISLRVQPKEIVCVIGESGCGKSTLLNAILRMPGRVEITQGEILYHGCDIETMTREEMRRIRGAGIGMIFQEPGASLDPMKKISAQFYRSMRAHAKISKNEVLEKADSLLLRMGFTDVKRILKSYPVQLSGGMNQRVAIALAMSLQPDILLADEPTSALDVIVQAQLVSEMLRLRKEFGTSILIVTHDMAVVGRMADKVAVMYSGRIVEYGGRDEVLKSPVHPYTRALIAAIPKLDGIPPKGIPGHRPQNYHYRGCGFASRCTYVKNHCTSRKMEKLVIEGDHWTLCDAGFEEEIR